MYSYGIPSEILTRPVHVGMTQWQTTLGISQDHCLLRSEPDCHLPLPSAQATSGSSWLIRRRETWNVGDMPSLLQWWLLSPGKGLSRGMRTSRTSGEELTGLKQQAAWMSVCHWSCLDVCMSLTSIVGEHKRKPCLPSTAGKDDLIELLYATAHFPLCQCLPVSNQSLKSCYHELEATFSHCFQFLKIYSISAVWLSDEQKESSSLVLFCHQRLWCTEHLLDSKAISLRCSSHGGGGTQRVESEAEQAA